MAYDQALQMIEGALEAFKQNYPQDTHLQAVFDDQLARIYMNKGELDKAYDLQKKVLDKTLVDLGTASSATIGSYDSLGEILFA